MYYFMYMNLMCLILFFILFFFTHLTVSIKYKMSSIIFTAFLLLCCCFVYLLAQACHLNQSKKLSLLSQLALPYNKMSSRSPSPKARYKLLSSRAAGSDEVSCFEPSPLPDSSPPSQSMQLDIEQGTAVGAWRNYGPSSSYSSLLFCPMCLLV